MDETISFIFYGVFVENDLPDEVYEKFCEGKDELDRNYLHGYEGSIFGFELASWDTLGIVDDMNTSPETLAAHRAQLKEVFKEHFDYEIEDKDFHLIAGTYEPWELG